LCFELKDAFGGLLSCLLKSGFPELNGAPEHYAKAAKDNILKTKEDHCQKIAEQTFESFLSSITRSDEWCRDPWIAFKMGIETGS